MDIADITQGAIPAVPIDPALQEDNDLMAETSSEQNRTSTTPSHSVTPQKRNRESLGPKNIQACDRCRTKKTKCLPRDNTRNLCQACFGAGLTCTFELPLTASRTKRVRKGLIGSQYGNGHDETAVGLGLLAAVLPESEGSYKRLRRSHPPISRAGPTSLEYILHSAPSLPLFVLDEWDHGRGVSIQRREERAGHVQISRQHGPEGADLRAISATTNALTWRRTIDGLVRDYFARVAPMFPIIEEQELVADDELLYHTAALVAATSRSCSRDVFIALRHIVNEAVTAEDVESIPSRRNVQVLLMLAMSDDTVPARSFASAQGVNRNRLLCAIQMLRDLEAVEAESHWNVLWAGATIVDLWSSAKNGSPLLSPDRDVDDRLRPHMHSNSFFSQHAGLSLLLHRVLSAVYSHDGVTRTSDAELEAIRDDLKRWRDLLPAHLRLTSLTSPVQAGMLHLLHVTVLFLLYRPFMRWSFDVDSRITFDLNLRVWSELHGASSSGLEWVSNLPDVSELQCWGGYAVGMASFLQYHHWARRRDGGGVIMLEKVKDSGRAWTEDGKLSELRRELDVVEVLYEATGKLSGTRPDELLSFERGLHPTAGSLNRPKR